jgi:monofunctional biosynthetic peptidoglycan transglycosylase
MSSRFLFDFSSPTSSDPAAWRAIDDVVMGGVSESEFVATEDGAAFTGTVSLEQGGGFASVRAPEGAWDLSDAEGLRLRVKGDGKRYWLTMFTDPDGSISYRAPLEPPQHWTDITVSFDRLTPYRRGTRVPTAPSFDPAGLRTLGFLIADEQAGPFHLDVRWIRADEGSPSA